MEQPLINAMAAMDLGLAGLPLADPPPPQRPAAAAAPPAAPAAAIPPPQEPRQAPPRVIPRMVPEFGSQPEDPEVTIARRARRDVIGHRPCIKLRFALSTETLNRVEREYDCTFLTYLSGRQPPNALQLVHIAYLEAVAFYDITRGPREREYSVTCAGPRLVFQPVCVVTNDHTIANGFTPCTYTADGTCSCGAESAIECHMPADAYYLGTSVGNMTLAHVAAFVQTGRPVYAIFPQVTNISGSVNDQLSYHVPAAGLITWDNAGHVFTTLDPHYLQDGFAFTPGANLDIESVRAQGMRVTPISTERRGWCLYKITGYGVSDEYVPEWRHSRPPSELIDDFELKWDVLDPIDKFQAFSLAHGGTPSRSDAAWATLDIDSITYASAWICFTTKTKKSIVFSRNIAFTGLRLFMNRPRNAELLQKVTRYVAAEYGKLDSLPDNVKYEASTATVLYIMVRVGFEADLLQTHIGQAQAMWDQHRELIAFRRPFQLDKERIITGGVLFGASTYAAHVGSVQTRSLLQTGYAKASHVLYFKHAVATSAIAAKTATTAAAAGTTLLGLPAAIAVVATVALGSFALQQYRDHCVRASVVQRIQAPPDELPPVLPPGVYPLPEGVRLGATTAIKTTIPPQAVNTMVVEPIGAVIPKAPTEKVSAVGLVFQITPSYFENNPENQFMALASRLTIATPTPVEGLWAKVSAAVLQTPLQQAHTRAFNSPDKVFRLSTSSVAAYASKFPQAHARELLDAWHSFVIRGGHIKASDLLASSFVKGELHVKPMVIEELTTLDYRLEPGTPRCIISFKPIVNATLGPLVAHASAIIKAQRIKWVNDPNSPIEYLAYAPSGASGEVLGTWAVRVIEHYGGEECCVFIALDDPKRDAHQTKDSKSESRKMTVERVKGPDMAMLISVLNQMDKVAGRSQGGVVFAAEGGRVSSGEPVTSIVNTATTEAKESYALSKNIEDIPKDAGPNYCMSAQGDDGFVIVRMTWWNSRWEGLNVQEAFKARCVELGFETEFRVSYGKMFGDFCSRLWYPVAGGRLLGGKIGRTLTKVGYFFETSDSQSVLSAAIGALQDNYHVPFLREYFETVVTLGKRQNMRKRGRPNEYSVHMASRHEYDDSTLAFVEEVYGLTRQDLRDFTTLLSQVKSLPTLVSWPKLEHCLAVDLA